MPLRTDDFLPHFEPLRRFRRRSSIERYAVAVASVAVALVIRLSLGHVMISGIPFITFYPAILITAFLAGWGPGMLAVALSAAAADYFFLPPPIVQLTLGDAIALATFVTVSSVIVGVIHLLNVAVDHLSAQEQNTRTILENIPAGMIAVDEAGVITLVNATAEKLFGYDRKELLGANFDILVPGRVRLDHGNYHRAYMAQPLSRPMGAGRDLYALRKGGNEVPVEIGLSPVVREERRGALATIVDISERKAAERRQQVLAHEVQHRAKNVLSIVQAIAMRTIADDRDRENFVSKVQAMSRTQELFFKKGGATLGDTVRGEVAGFAGQVVIEGGEISMNPRAAQDFTLIVHELAINALKHGALSKPSGKVAICWSTEGGCLTFEWAEADGPRVVAAKRKGFGQVVLNDVARAFGAEVKTDYAASGLRYLLKVELGTIAEVGETEEVALAAS
jgi:PAS domain S-box-containing protein